MVVNIVIHPKVLVLLVSCIRFSTAPGFLSNRVASWLLRSLACTKASLLRRSSRCAELMCTFNDVLCTPGRCSWYLVCANEAWIRNRWLSVLFNILATSSGLRSDSVVSLLSSILLLFSLEIPFTKILRCSGFVIPRWHKSSSFKVKNVSKSIPCSQNNLAYWCSWCRHKKFTTSKEVPFHLSSYMVLISEVSLRMSGQVQSQPVCLCHLVTRLVMHLLLTGKDSINLSFWFI